MIRNRVLISSNEFLARVSVQKKLRIASNKSIDRDEKVNQHSLIYHVAKCIYSEARVIQCTLGHVR